MFKKVFKIAICDDRMLDRTIERLCVEGYFEAKRVKIEIDEFESGEELLRQNLKAYKLFFLDIYMGETNGIDTAKKILDANEEAKIIFCSASPEFGEESEALSAIHYFIKPLTREKLYGTLETIFGDNRK